MLEDKADGEKAEWRLDIFDGAIEMNEDNGCNIFRYEKMLEGKINDISNRPISFLEEIKALEFALPLVRNGYIPRLG